MKAGELLHGYRRRQAGYEEGLLKYDAGLYKAVCALVDRLAQLPSDEEIRINMDAADGVFILARTGIELARLPTRAVEVASGEDAG
jgi:hypothetical protein